MKIAHVYIYFKQISYCLNYQRVIALKVVVANNLSFTGEHLSRRLLHFELFHFCVKGIVTFYVRDRHNLRQSCYILRRNRNKSSEFLTQSSI